MQLIQGFKAMGSQQYSWLTTCRTCIQVPKHERCLIGLAHRLICEVYARITLHNSLQHLRRTNSSRSEQHNMSCPAKNTSFSLHCLAIISCHPASS